MDRRPSRPNTAVITKKSGETYYESGKPPRVNHQRLIFRCEDDGTFSVAHEFAKTAQNSSLPYEETARVPLTRPDIVELIAVLVEFRKWQGV